MTPVVFLHGWGLSSAVWRGVVSDIAPRRALALDLPGHGDVTQAPAAFTAAVERLARDLPPRAAICGWSLGALFALALARRHAESVAALVLVGGTPCFVQREDWRWGMSRTDFEAFANGMDEDPASTRAHFISLCGLGSAESRASIREVKALLGRTPPPAREALGWLRDTDLRGEAASIDVPTLLVHGGADRVADVAAARWLRGEMRAARLAEIPDAGHLPFVSHRRRFVHELEAFLA